MERASLVILRDNGGGSYNTAGEWVDSATVNVKIKCSIQPYSKGTSQMTLPEGLQAEDTNIVYTKTPIKTVNQYDFTTADRTTIDGLVYVALNSANWNRMVSQLGHYKVMFVRADKLPNGGL